MDGAAIRLSSPGHLTRHALLRREDLSVVAEFRPNSFVHSVCKNVCVETSLHINMWLSVFPLEGDQYESEMHFFSILFLIEVDKIIHSIIC